MPLRPLFCALLAAVTLAAAAVAQAPAAAPGAFGDARVWQFPPSRTYHVENYKIGLRIDETRDEIFGDETVTLHPFASGFREFYLDCAELTIDGVSLLSPSGEGPLAFHLQVDQLWITLDRAYGPADTLRVRIRYHGFPHGTGLTLIHGTPVHPDAADPSRPEEVWSYGWPENNHYWFPCWDYPNDKATSETIVTVPEGQSVVSNGALVKVTHSSGEVTDDWVEDVPHSSYLVSIAVAAWNHFSQRYEGKTVDYYVPPSVDRATALRSFGLTPDMIGFYAHTYGVDYPYAKYAQTAARDFGGGLENISATTLTDATLHDARADADYPSIGLVSHELAHQWFGDLITERSWANAWLSEGFATFSAALYTGHHSGSDAYRYEIWQDQNTARNEDDTRYRRPMVDWHYLLPWQMLDRTTYQKGAVVLDMLRYVLDGGATPVAADPSEPLFQSLKRYLETYRAQNVDSYDLLGAIRETTGRDLSGFFHEWVFMGGYPEYRVAARYDSGRRMEIVRVLQTQTLSAVTPLFDMPVELAFHGANGESRSVIERDDQADQSFEIPLAFAPRWVDFDPHDHIYKTLDFSQPAAALIAAAENDPAMMSRLAATMQLARVSGADAPAAVAALTQVLASDGFVGVRVAAAQSLAELGGSGARGALLAALSPKVQSSSHVRAAAAAALGKYAADPAVYSALVDVLHNDPSYAAEAAAARAIGGSGVAGAFDVLAAAAETHPSRYVMAGVLAGLVAARDARAPALLQAQAAPGMPAAIRQMAERYLRSAARRPPGIASAPPPHLEPAPAPLPAQIRALRRQVQQLQQKLAATPQS